MNFYRVVAEILANVYKSHSYYFHRLKARRLLVQKRSLLISLDFDMLEKIKEKISTLKGNSDLAFVGGLFLAIFPPCSSCTQRPSKPSFGH